MHVLRAGHLALDNQLGCSSWGKATSPIPGSPRWPIVLCVELKHGRFPSILACPLGLYLFGSYFGSHVNETVCVLLLIRLGDTVSQETAWSSGSDNLSNSIFKKGPKYLFFILFFLKISNIIVSICPFSLHLSPDLP